MEGPPKKIEINKEAARPKKELPLEEVREQLENPLPNPSDAVWDALIEGGEPSAPETEEGISHIVGRWRTEELPPEETVVEAPPIGTGEITEAVTAIENAPPAETTPAIFGITPEELAQTEGWAALSEGQQRLALLNLKQITLARIKEESSARYKKGIADEKTGAALWRKMWVGMRENFAKSYKTVKLEKTVAEELKEGGMALHGEVLAQVIRAAKNGPEVKIKENGEIEFVYLSSDIVEFSAEDKEKTNVFNNAAAEFARVPDEWKYETANDRQRRAYEKAREKYETARGNILEMIYLSERSLNASEAMAQENAMLFVNEVDGKVRMNQFFTAHPDAEKEIANIEDTPLWKQVGAEYVKGALEKGGYGLLGYGARWASTSLLGLIGAPLVSAGIGGFRARKKAKERVSEQEIMARRGVKEGYEAWQKNIVEAESLTKKLEKLSNQASEVDEEGGMSEEKKKLLADLSLRMEYTQRKLDDELVGFGRAEKKADNQYKLLNALAFARTALESETRGAKGALSLRLERFLKFKEQSIPEARRKFLNREFLRGAAVAAGFAAAGWLIRDFFAPSAKLTEEELKAMDEEDMAAFGGVGLGEEAVLGEGWAHDEIPPPDDAEINALDREELERGDETWGEGATAPTPKETTAVPPEAVLRTRGISPPASEVAPSSDSPPSPESMEGMFVKEPPLSEPEQEVMPDALTPENLDAMQAEEPFAEEMPPFSAEQAPEIARRIENNLALSREKMRTSADGMAKADVEIRRLWEQQGVPPAEAMNNSYVIKLREDAAKIFHDAADTRAEQYSRVREILDDPHIAPEAKLIVIDAQADDASRVSHLAKLATLVENEPAMQQLAEDDLYPVAVDDWVEAHGNAVKVNEELMVAHPELRALRDVQTILIEKRDALLKEFDEDILEDNALPTEELVERQHEIEEANRALDEKIKEYAAVYKKILNPETAEAAQRLQKDEIIDRVHEKLYGGKDISAEVREMSGVGKEGAVPQTDPKTEQPASGPTGEDLKRALGKLHEKVKDTEKGGKGGTFFKEVADVWNILVEMNEKNKVVASLGTEVSILTPEATSSGEKFIKTFDRLSYYEQEGFLSHLRQHLESVKAGRTVLGADGARYTETLEKLTDTLEARVKIPASEMLAPELVEAVSEAFTGEWAAEARDLIHRYALTRGGVSPEKLTAFVGNMDNIDKSVMKLLFKEGGDSEENRLELLKIILRHPRFEIDRFTLKQAEGFEDLVEDSDRFGGVLKYLDNEKISFEERRQMLANYLASRTLFLSKVTKEGLPGLTRGLAPEGREGAIEALVREAVSR